MTTDGTVFQPLFLQKHASHKEDARRILEINAQQLSLQEKQPAFLSVIGTRCYILNKNLTQAYNTFMLFHTEIVCYLPNLTSKKKQRCAISF